VHALNALTLGWVAGRTSCRQ